jgi:hypothetical protein
MSLCNPGERIWSSMVMIPMLMVPMVLMVLAVIMIAVVMMVVMIVVVIMVVIIIFVMVMLPPPVTGWIQRMVIAPWLGVYRRNLRTDSN